MEQGPKDIMILGAIKQGVRKFNKIQKIARIQPKELDSILEQLEKDGFIRIEEKKGWLGRKIEIFITREGVIKVEQYIEELQTRWGQMSILYNTGNKEKLKQHMDQNRSFLPMMLFFGIMDVMMFSMMFSMMGMPMTDYVPAENIPEGMDDGGGMDGADGGGMDGADGGGMDGADGGGMDFDIGF